MVHHTADNPPWIKALAEVRRLAPREGWCYHHVQAIIVSIDQYAESALGNREYFLNRPYGLRDSRILHSHCNTIAFSPVGELGPAGSHGLWTGRFVVAIPSAATGNDPGQPGQRAFGLRTLLSL